MSRRVSAQVQVELKVMVHVGSWQATASFEELMVQAEREAKAAITQLCRNTSIRLVNEPGVMSVLVKESN